MNSFNIYKNLVRPLFFQFDPEEIHHFSMGILAHTPLSQMLGGFTDQEALDQPVTLWDLEFRNPLGLAAGFDKNALALNAWKELGFGFVELGTVTRYAQPGNPLPRIFRCPKEQGVINRMGFPNDGAEAIRARVEKQRELYDFRGFPIGANIGKSKVTELEDAASDYLFSLQQLYQCSEFFVVNVSSPNTPRLRNLQSREALEPILKELQDYNLSRDSKPLLVKIAPDLEDSQIDDVIDLTNECQLSGIVATNTTIDHSSVTLKEQGGLSGRPVTQRSHEILKGIVERSENKFPVIGVGGIFNRDDYLQRMEAGASLVELYTGFIYEGPFVAQSILAPSDND